MNLFQVDAFTDQPFKGNPAGVCLLGMPKPESWMLSVAREMNLSETAFLFPQGKTSYNLRWFTPATEVSLCGHATLASAHVIWEEKLLPSTEMVTFMTKSGDLSARRAGDAIEMSFPARQVQPAAHNEELNRSLRTAPIFTGRYAAPKGDLYLLEVDSEASLRAIAPDYQQLASTPARAVILTSRSSDSRYDFVSRYFAPAVGINEDPVTGSAHCYLAPYWGEKLGKKQLTGYQASERTGIVQCRWAEDRVWLGGRAVTVFKADLLV